MAETSKCSKKQKKKTNNIDLGNQTDITSDGSRTCPRYEEDAFKEFLETNCIETLNHFLTMGMKESRNGQCLGKLNNLSCQYDWISYSEVTEKVTNLGFGLRNLATMSGCKYRIGIYTMTLVESFMVEYGCYSSGLIVVPLDENLTPKDCACLLNEMNIGCVIVDTQERVEALVSQASYLITVKYIVVIGKILESYRSKAHGLGIIVKTLDEVMDIGENDPIAHEDKVKSDDTALICFTNGTTGKPKGVFLSHWDIVTNSVGIITRLGDHKPKNSDTIFCCFPITQMYQRCLQAATLMAGGRLGFSELGLVNAWKEMKFLKPTIAITTARLIKYLHDTLYLKVRGNKVTEWFLVQALAGGKGCSGKQRGKFWQNLIMSKIRGTLGGSLRLVIVAKSHLPRYLMNFVRSSLGAVVCSSYGLKEAGGPCTMSYPEDESTEHVGTPLPMISIKLVGGEDPELGKNSTWEEICIKGCKKFRSDVNTKTLGDDSLEEWFKTGDVGFWRSNGTLEVVDRKDDIIKLVYGARSYIAPGRIEAIYCQSQFVDHIYLHGEPSRSLVGVVLPEKRFIMVWARENGLKGTFFDLCKHQATHEEIIADLRCWGRRYGLEPYEQIKIISLVSEPFSTRNDLLNPILIKNRHECHKKFFKLIQGMYAHDPK